MIKSGCSKNSVKSRVLQDEDVDGACEMVVALLECALSKMLYCENK